MTTKLLAVLVAAVSFSSITYAASVTPGSGVSILYINGQPASDKLGKNELEDGLNQIIVRMDKNMARSGASSSDVFTSKPYVLTIEKVKGDLEIFHPQARSMMEAKKAFSSNQPNWVLEQNGKVITYQQEVLQGKSGLFPYLGMEKLVAEHNQARGVYFNGGKVVDKPVAVEAPVATTSEAPIVQQEEKVVTTNIEQLKAWYLKSSAEERKAFRKWIVDQE